MTGKLEIEKLKCPSRNLQERAGTGFAKFNLYRGKVL
jgi:hypothetical protein